jgi:hypothetical protein
MNDPIFGSEKKNISDQRGHLYSPVVTQIVRREISLARSYPVNNNIQDCYPRRIGNGKQGKTLTEKIVEREICVILMKKVSRYINRTEELKLNGSILK